MQHADSQQIEVRSSIHLALEKLEPVDVTFCLAVAPMRAEGRAHGRQVSIKSGDKAAELGHYT